ncbi:response regulator transcription factor [Evansella tamaricis]|uniref:LuxR C-terminal-related transcriptional regulator n=1 Tax=Evansella tamaricis TaxID=2069301 RepID=A0ABS6JDK3_9BACI|nr:LuxR C-terminal-related transcriptional regulator [Evansella tamaricis]MBU9711760.1 LuxR C-terminal-related transcriptional regulator [Evansella tamaricis]
MLTITKEQTRTQQHKILFFDRENHVSPETINLLMGTFTEGSILRQTTITSDNLGTCEYLFYFVDGYDRKSVQSLEELLESSTNLTSEKKLPIILVHRNCSEKDLFHYLAFPISGIVTLSYLESHFTQVIQILKQKGVFLEPTFHRELVHEIERKKMKDKPIKKLVLNRNLVASVLSQNEQDVLQFILDGHNNRRIAELLYLAPSTVSTIISHLLKKMQANDRTDAMVTAIRKGWVEAHR